MDKSYFVAYSQPLVSQIVPAAEDLQVVPIGHQLLDVLVDLLWLLTLPSTITKNDVSRYTMSQFWRVSFNSN